MDADYADINLLKVHKLNTQEHKVTTKTQIEVANKPSLQREQMTERAAL